MWQRFYPFEADQKQIKQVSTRLSDKKESTKIIEAIQELHKKKIELKASADKIGVDSIEHAKHRIVAELLKKIDYFIRHFNSKPAYADTIRELQESLNLFRELFESINEVLNNKEYKEILSQFRNKNREYARTGLTIGVWSGIGLALVFSSVTAGASVFVASLGGASVLENQTNINSPVPETYKLIYDLMNILKLTIKNLVLRINMKQLDSDQSVKLSDEDNMVCPITQALIRDPVLFLLDHYSYEREALVKWLSNHRRSPMTDKEMTKHQKIEDVIIANQNLKHVIDNYTLCMKVASTPIESDGLLPSPSKSF